MKFLFLSLGIISLSSLTSCTYNKKEVTNETCDSTNVKYSTRVSQILSDNCYSCHKASVAASSGGGTVLDNYTDVSNWVDTTTGSDGGRLLTDTMHTTNAMPKPPAAKLSDCDIAAIKNWILAGAPNN